MIRLTAIAALLAVTACSDTSIVDEAEGNTVILSGGPASITSTAKAIAFHQPAADQNCQSRGYKGATFAGERESAFFLSYIFTCVS